MPRILLVEDDADAREVMSLMLVTHEIECVAGVGAALLSLESATPDLIVTDMRLGDQTGLELVQILESRGLRIPTVIVTGFVESGQEPSGLVKGYLHKPFTSAELRKLVNRVLADAAAS